jgi:hypothetical protein
VIWGAARLQKRAPAAWSAGAQPVYAIKLDVRGFARQMMDFRA